MLVASLDAKVRPLSNTSLEKSSLLGAARIYVSRDSLLSLTGTLENGKHCLVTRLDSPVQKDAADDPGEIQREASLWILPEKNLSPNVVMMTRAFQEAAGFKLGDQVRITLAGTTPDVEEVIIEDEAGDKAESGQARKYPLVWEPALSLSLDRAELIFPGMVLEGVAINKVRRNFKVLSVNSQANSVARFKTESSTIRILQPGEETGPVVGEAGGDLLVTGVPGFPVQVKTINNFLRGFCRPFYARNERQSCGLIIHGGRGTGKTFILQRIAATNWGRVHWIKPSDKLTTIRETFKLAQTQQPSVILIDELDGLISKDRSNRDSVIEAIGEELDNLSALAAANNALPKLVVIATCLDYFTDVPPKLQKLTRFSKNIALPIPRTLERLEILKFVDPPIKAEEREQLLLNMAERTHAFNPNDIGRLVSNAMEIFGTRLDDSGVDSSLGEEQHLVKTDLEKALRNTRPTAMNDINLNPPTIHWQDIGGQHTLKKALNLMVKYTKNPERFLRPPGKGILLYGPPGCSKTLSAQATATESGFNFFAVKGAELLNMYVGESERAVRTLFERARAASPSIIFFDEIDSIGGQRTGSGGTASRSTGAVNMLTTLLTEMDGFETLTGVLVLAATNRPESIDPALMRPGRFDQVLYVGPPDQAARETIFKVNTRGLPVAEDVNIPELARRAEGHSGAEIKAACNDACVIAQGSFDDEEGDAVSKPQVKMADLEGALERMPRNITKQMIDGYEKWSKQFRKL
ncbi:P-loop containing nucleoside triphosphate hydrolase protein [Dactylonectria macrodidyma]|uniref:P-loop containing nucleoside triphosphate hydrolase protein n=1 Tax=Dactylonectria macrodidyma TaxID=307937 RepID=A0A9P9JBY6_9HYPO|nr:P-loop containing nucleoside triphosphate hydrolase protein [Dactylonectria macrodidyma]